MYLSYVYFLFYGYKGIVRNKINIILFLLVVVFVKSYKMYDFVSFKNWVIFFCRYKFLINYVLLNKIMKGYMKSFVLKIVVMFLSLLILVEFVWFVKLWVS